MSVRPSIVTGWGKPNYMRMRVTVQFRTRITGGVPKDPNIIVGWIKSKMPWLNTAEHMRTVIELAREGGVDFDPGYTLEEQFKLITGDPMITVGADSVAEKANALAEQIAFLKHAQGFNRGSRGLFIPTRYVKANLREVVNINFPKTRWGVSGKGAKNFFVERVFVDSIYPDEPDNIYLGRQHPDDIITFIGHTSGPNGPQNNMTFLEVAFEPIISFDISVWHDEVPLEAWPDILELSQDIGLGAQRSQGSGRFNVLDIQILDGNRPTKLKPPTITADERRELERARDEQDFLVPSEEIDTLVAAAQAADA